ncbi:MAG: hypothetical protein ACE5R4_03920 [Armatimonadota bacterium]
MKRAVAAMAAVVLCLALPLSVASGQAAGAGGVGAARPPQMGQVQQAMLTIETYWAIVAFELKLDDAKLAELRPLFLEAWDARRQAVQKARDGGDRRSMMDAIRDVNSALEAALKQALSEDEFARVKAAAARGPLAVMRPAGGGGAGPADPPPPPGPGEGVAATAEVGKLAPDFALEPIEIHEDFRRWLGAEAPQTFQDKVMLSDFVGKAPIVLLFGSYT